MDEMKQRMRRAGYLLLLVMLLLTGCKEKEKEKHSGAEVQCEKFMNALQAGDWNTVQRSLEMDGMTNMKPDVENGIFQAMLGRMKYEIVSSEEKEDGIVEVKLKIQNIDMNALLEALPEDISSEEEARAAMVELVDDMELKAYDAEVYLVWNESQEKYDVIPGDNFGNALTGGLYDLVSELTGGTVTNETE